MSKYRSKNGGTPEVHSARSKLDGVLQTLVDKKEESPVKEEPSPSADDYIDSTPTTPTRRSSGKQSRKRRRGRDDTLAADQGQYHHTFVMKLFDRSVDLAQFDEEAPLYPICRAWMRNQPHNKSLANRDRTPSPTPPSDDDEESGDLKLGEEIYRLPSPVRVKEEPGSSTDLRVPSPVSQPNETLDIHADPSTAPPPETLLINHMARWKEIRQKWKESGRKNETRYSNSLQILKNMYDKQCKEQS